MLTSRREALIRHADGVLEVVEQEEFRARRDVDENEAEPETSAFRVDRLVGAVEEITRRFVYAEVELAVRDGASEWVGRDEMVEVDS
jgi:hypothetical protein